MFRPFTRGLLATLQSIYNLHSKSLPSQHFQLTRNQQCLHIFHVLDTASNDAPAITTAAEAQYTACARPEADMQGQNSVWGLVLLDLCYATNLQSRSAFRYAMDGEHTGFATYP